MVTDFVCLKIDLEDDIAKLHDLVEVELRKYGRPLRWAITAVNSENKKVVLEAVVTND